MCSDASHGGRHERQEDSPAVSLVDTRAALVSATPHVSLPHTHCFEMFLSSGATRPSRSTIGSMRTCVERRARAQSKQRKAGWCTRCETEMEAAADRKHMLLQFPSRRRKLSQSQGKGTAMFALDHTIARAAMESERESCERNRRRMSCRSLSRGTKAKPLCMKTCRFCNIPTAFSNGT